MFVFDMNQRFLYFFNILFISCGKFGQPYLGKATAAARAALASLQVHAGSFPVLVIHETVTWITASLTNIRDHSYTCVRIHTRVWAHRQQVSTTFLTQKNVTFSCAPDGVALI